MYATIDNSDVNSAPACETELVDHEGIWMGFWRALVVWREAQIEISVSVVSPTSPSNRIVCPQLSEAVQIRGLRFYFSCEVSVHHRTSSPLVVARIDENGSTRNRCRGSCRCSGHERARGAAVGYSISDPGRTAEIGGERYRRLEPSRGRGGKPTNSKRPIARIRSSPRNQLKARSQDWRVPGSGMSSW